MGRGETADLRAALGKLGQIGFERLLQHLAPLGKVPDMGRGETVDLAEVGLERLLQYLATLGEMIGIVGDKPVDFRLALR